MKKTFKVVGRIIGYWIICISLFCVISPLIFPFHIWYGFQDVFNIFIFALPIGILLRFINLSYDSEKEKILHIMKDILIILLLVNIPALSISIAYIVKNGAGYNRTIIRTLLIGYLEVIGYIYTDGNKCI